MNEYKLNFLRWLTRGEFPDNILKSVTDFKVEGDRFTFKYKATAKSKDWCWAKGSAK